MTKQQMILKAIEELEAAKNIDHSDNTMFECGWRSATNASLRHLEDIRDMEE